MANNVDLDETAHDEPSHQDLHCFTCICFCGAERAHDTIIISCRFWQSILATNDQGEI